MQDVAEVTFPRRLNQDVKMIWQENIPKHGKGMDFLHVMKYLAQEVNIFGVMKNRLALLHDLRDEYRRTRDIIPTKIHIDIIR